MVEGNFKPEEMLPMVYPLVNGCPVYIHTRTLCSVMPTSTARVFGTEIIHYWTIIVMSNSYSNTRVEVVAFIYYYYAYNNKAR